MMRLQLSEYVVVGDRVSYEDQANPRKCGRVSAFDGHDYTIIWDDDTVSFSDCRQRGWALVPEHRRPFDEIAELYQVAEDWEADVLDALRHRAGHLWTCECSESMNWTNLAAEVTCGNCGEAQS